MANSCSSDNNRTPKLSLLHAHVKQALAVMLIIAGRFVLFLRRKNYLFCGSEQAAKNASLIYSIIGSCKMNGLRLVKYIADVLRKLVSGDTDYMALLPMNIGK